MDVRQLKQFVAVAETLHFGKAAERLNMTQPPLSQAIRALEEEIGAALFERSKRNVSLTPLGEQWLPHVREALAKVDALHQIAKDIRSGTTGRLDLAFVTTADNGLLPNLVRHYRNSYPNVELTLVESTSDAQITLLLEEKVHAGIIIPSHEHPLPWNLQYMPLVREQLVAAVPETWISSGNIQTTGHMITTDSVISSPLIIFPRRAAPSFHDLVTGYYKACGGQVRIVQHAIQMQTIISLVSAGMGIALVPESMRNVARKGVSYLNLSTSAPLLETGLAWRRNEDLPTVTNLIELARSLFPHSTLNDTNISEKQGDA